MCRCVSVVCHQCQWVGLTLTKIHRHWHIDIVGQWHIGLEHQPPFFYFKTFFKKFMTQGFSTVELFTTSHLQPQNNQKLWFWAFWLVVNQKNLVTDMGAGPPPWGWNRDLHSSHFGFSRAQKVRFCCFAWFLGVVLIGFWVFRRACGCFCGCDCGFNCTCACACGFCFPPRYFSCFSLIFWVFCCFSDFLVGFCWFCCFLVL